jgi:hypothetical protein
LEATPKDENGIRTFALLPAGCTARADRQVSVAVR